MITHRFKLSEANEALRVMESKEAVKAIIYPHDCSRLGLSRKD